MSTVSDNLIHTMSDAGIAAEHPPPAKLPILLAPTTENQFNTLRPQLAPIACWSIGDARFKFGSSFIYPEVAEDMRSLAALVLGLEKKHGKRPVASVFGHADPVGQDDFNKKLSGRRAAAVYAMLTRRTDIWEDIFSHKGEFTSPLSADDWGDPVIHQLLTDLGYAESRADDSSIPGDNGQPSSSVDPVQAFQHDHGLVEDGDVGPNTRRALFEGYMDKYCRDRRSDSFTLEATDFLARGEDAAGKGDYQSCSEFNPLSILSKQEQDDLSIPTNKAKRDCAKTPNRRVLIYLFHPHVGLDVNNWPCARAKEGVVGCKKRFWSDGEERRNRREPDRRRNYGESEETFAWRFYDRIANKSPCEHLRDIATIINLRLHDEVSQPMG